MEKTTSLIDRTFNEDGLLAQKIKGYKVRTQQVELAKKIEECIEKETPLVAEAPTGVGKSLGALVPAFYHIHKTDEPVIVATSSIVLQEQYINKDVPMLEELYDFNVNPVLIKGRNNYLCPKKLNEAKKGKVGFSSTNYAEAFEDVLKWATLTKTGDKSELDFVPPTPVWASVACLEQNECQGKQCPFYNVCPYYRERQKISSSKLVVTNYHYLFSGLGEVGMLPDKAKVIILDEGHEISTIARDFQERKYSMNSLRNQIDHFAKAYQKALMSGVSDTVYGYIEEANINNVNGTMTDMFVGLTHEYKKIVNKFYQRDFWQVDIAQRTFLQKYATPHIETIKNAVEISSEYLKHFGFSFEELPAMLEIYGEDSVEWMVEVAKTADYLEQRILLLEYFFAYEKGADHPDDIFWLQMNNESVELHVKPTTGSGLTGPIFDEQSEYIPIVMSATLAANKNFDHVKEDLGITPNMGVQEIIVSSPFNLSENVLWYLPPNCPEGNKPGHIDFVLQEMRKIIEELHGKTLCLFTSRKNLIAAQDYFMKILPPSIRILSQEHTPKQQIIDYMKNHDNTVILGTKSFFTGVDIQGQNLSAVLIDKIPFPMIGDPVNDTLMSQPRGFHKYSLPEAIITLKQGFGRLNRTSSDKGIVAMFDGRLSTANYKNKIFNSFDFKIQATQDWSRVQDYIQRMFN